MEEFFHLLFARQLWERNEKLGKSQRPFFAPMKAALVKKMPEIYLMNVIVHFDKKGDKKDECDHNDSDCNDTCHQCHG